MRRRWKRRIAYVVGTIVLVASSSFLAWWFYAISKPYLGALCLGLVLGLAAAPSLQKWPFFRRMAPLPGGLQTPKKRKWWHLPFMSKLMAPKEARP